MNKIVVYLAGVLALMAFSTSVWATPISPGTSVVPSFQSMSGFVVQMDTGPQSFTLADGTTGTVDAQVGTISTNPFTGGLTFTYQVSVSSGLVEHLSGSSFANFMADVAFDNSVSGTVAPNTANRSGSFDNGKVIEFNGEWIQGQTSAVLMINTDAKTFTSGTIGIIDGAATTLTGFAPVANISEPTSLLLLGGCFIGLGGMAACRRWWT
jgi:hypothetical protein